MEITIITRKLNGFTHLQAGWPKLISAWRIAMFRFVSGAAIRNTIVLTFKRDASKRHGPSLPWPIPALQQRTVVLRHQHQRCGMLCFYKTDDNLNCDHAAKCADRLERELYSPTGNRYAVDATCPMPSITSCFSRWRASRHDYDTVFYGPDATPGAATILGAGSWACLDFRAVSGRSRRPSS